MFNDVLYTRSYGRVIAQSLDGNGVSPIALSKKRLMLTGTEAGEDITVAVNDGAIFSDDIELRFTRGVWSRIYPETAISSVVLNAGAGDDTIEIDLANEPSISVVVNAGAGNDAITATGAHITVHGGAGDDKVKGDSSDSECQRGHQQQKDRRQT